jgi:hypothetical protein
MSANGTDAEALSYSPFTTAPQYMEHNMGGSLLAPNQFSFHRTGRGGAAHSRSPFKGPSFLLVDGIGRRCRQYTHSTVTHENAGGLRQMPPSEITLQQGEAEMRVLC